MSGAKEPPIGIVLDTRIEDGDPGDEDANAKTPQTATLALNLTGESFPLIYGRVRVAALPEISYAGYARVSAPVDVGAESIAESLGVSDRYATEKGMKGLAQGAEAEARLNGLMAILSLPLVREGKVIVQVEVTSGTWLRVDGVNIDSESVTFLSGTNGKATPFRFLNGEGVPAWRTVALSKRQRNSLEHE